MQINFRSLFISHISSLFITWHGKNTIIFNAKIILMHLHSEEALFSPVSSPWVSSDPVLYSIFNTPSNDWDFMINHWPHFLLGVDAWGILLEGISDFNTATNWSSSQLFLHIVSTSYASVILGVISSVVSDSSASA